MVKKLQNLEKNCEKMRKNATSFNRGEGGERGERGDFLDRIVYWPRERVRHLIGYKL